MSNSPRNPSGTPSRRPRLTAAYKARIRAQCGAEGGAVAVILRTDGLYPGRPLAWRRARALAPVPGASQKRARKPRLEHSGVRLETERLKTELVEARATLRKAERMLEAQKALSTMLRAIPKDPTEH